MARYGRQCGPLTLITAAQDLTGAWADLGSEINVVGVQKAGLYINLDINDSTNARVRALAKHTSAGADEYSLPISTISASDVAVEPEYIEFNVDADQKVILGFDLDNVIAYVQFQVMAGAVGATAGQIDSALLILGY